MPVTSVLQCQCTRHMTWWWWCVTEESQWLSGKAVVAGRCWCQWQGGRGATVRRRAGHQHQLRSCEQPRATTYQEIQVGAVRLFVSFAILSYAVWIPYLALPKLCESFGVCEGDCSQELFEYCIVALGSFEVYILLSTLKLRLQC